VYPSPHSPRAGASAKKAKAAKRAGRTKTSAIKPPADRANKEAEVIAMMKRAKGATLPEIMKATSWQPHTVRGVCLRSCAALFH
jgi:hypothetical protein